MEKYLFSLALLLAGIGLLKMGLKRYNSKEYYSEITAISGSLKYLDKEKLRYGVRYNVGLTNDRRNFRIPDITSRSFDFINFQKNVSLGDSIVLQLNRSYPDKNQEIIGITSRGVSYFDFEKRNSLRRKNGMAAILSGIIFVGSAIWKIKDKTKYNKV
ncbi:MAG: hypothetical protein R2798_14825 [Chitinophagales bacterium]|nr:hypothetical protein [Bacteroidota bacterium]MCB9043297.1 hypothetical protein [Chitinophagales bacterium]